MDKLLNTPLKDLPVKSPSIISVNCKDTIEKALHVLQENDINSIGVFDTDGDCLLGLVSVLDIMTFVCFGTFKMDDKPDTVPANMEALQTNIGSIIGVFHEETNQIWNFDESEPLSALLEAMHQGVHRAVIVTHKGEYKIISQHDVIKYLFTQDNNNKSKTLEELKLGNPKKQPCSVSSDKTALMAFRRMHIEDYSALPIIDKDSNKIVGTISSSDVRYVKSDNMNSVLKNPIDFLTTTKGKVESPMIGKHSDKLEDVMFSLVNNHHKHMWITDSNDEFVGTVTLSDIIYTYTPYYNN